MRALWTVRVRTTVAATVVVGLALLVGGWLLVVTLESSLEDRVEVAARAWVRDLAALAATGQLPALVPPHGEDDVGQVVAADGTVLASTRNVAGRPPVTRVPAGPTPRVVDVRDVPDGDELEDYRVWTLSAETAGGPVVAYAAVPTETVTETVAPVRHALLLGLPLALLLVAGGTWVSVGRALGPVEQLRAEVAGLSEADLSRRVPVPHGRDEIALLARTMNAMLDRLERAAARQRAFVADASHELQSPLAAFRTELEVALAQPERADWPQVARDLLRRGHELEALARDLLFLAGAEQVTARAGATGPVDLDDVVLDEVSRVRAVSPVPVDASGVSAAPVRGSREQLARLVRNLLENAVRHAAGAVSVRLATSDDGWARLEVVDDGPGVQPGDRDRVFDRFVRLDSSRSRGGTGLGLAIVASIASAHGGSVAVAGDGPGATFVVRLPGDGSR